GFARSFARAIVNACRHAHPVRRALFPHAKLSCAGLTRASIEKILSKRMDCRVKPGNDEIAASELAARRRTGFGNSHLTMSNSSNLLVPAARLRPGFASLLHSPRIEGWAERRETFGCSGTRRARHNAAYQAPSEAPCVP